MFDVTIIGAGITGSAAAFYFSQYELSVLVLEKENDVAMGTTRANSAIVHAGYDPIPGSLMARLNVRGAKLTKTLCEKLNVSFSECGSLVLAFSEEEKEMLASLLERGKKNGVPSLSILTQAEIEKLEPNISHEAIAALYAPTAAIVNPWEFSILLLENAVANGVSLQLNSEVFQMEKRNDGTFQIFAGKDVYESRFVFNAAGVFSDEVHNLVAKPSFRIQPEKGEYFLLDKSEGNMVSHVIFQCPTDKGKGVLVAPTVHGNLLVGPDSVKISDKEDTKTTKEGLSFIAKASRRSVESLRLGASIRNFTGVRATTEHEDFVIGEAFDVKGFFDLSGIKSPGLTSAPAIGEMAVSLLENKPIELSRKKDWKWYPRKPLFHSLSVAEKKERIKQNSLYGHVVCRCETITEGDVLDAIYQVIPPVSLDGIKRRCGAGLGRCQGGFCAPRILEILSRERGIPLDKIPMDKRGSYILSHPTKMNVEDMENV